MSQASELKSNAIRKHLEHVAIITRLSIDEKMTAEKAIAKTVEIANS